MPSLLSFGRPVEFTPVLIDNQSEVPSRRQAKTTNSVTGRGPNQASEMIFDVPLGPTILLEVRAPTPERLSTGGLKALHSFEIFYTEGCYSRASEREKEEVGRVTHASASESPVQPTSDAAGADDGAWLGDCEGSNGPRRKRKHGGEA